MVYECAWAVPTGRRLRSLRFGGTALFGTLARVPNMSEGDQFRQGFAVVTVNRFPDNVWLYGDGKNRFQGAKSIFPG